MLAPEKGEEVSAEDLASHERDERLVGVQGGAAQDPQSQGQADGTDRQADEEQGVAPQPPAGWATLVVEPPGRLPER